LVQLRGNERDSLFRHPRDIDLDVQDIANPHLRDYAAGHYIQILESLEDTRQRAQIRFSRDP
jgi:hypothetical protein